eukprot:SM000014S00413  [mRNA]  locus=s14:1212399:1215934:+ [translate_table: standard]
MADDDSDSEPGKSISILRLDIGEPHIHATNQADAFHNTEVATYEYIDSAGLELCRKTGGTQYTTTVDTLTQRDSTSMLGVMFGGRHRVHRDPKKGTVFIDRDGTHFRHVLNWLRDGCVPVLEGQIHQELVREAEYYQLQDMLEAMAKAQHLKELDSHRLPELTRQEVIKCLQNKRVRLRGVNLCGVNLSGLDMSGVDLSYAKLCGTSFQTAVLQCAIFKYAEADESNCSNAVFKECDFKGASLRKAVLAGTNLQSANLQDVNLSGATLCGADLQSAHLQNADLTDADLTGANLEGANLKAAKVKGTVFQGANLQRAYLRDVDLRHTILEGAKLGGANLQGTAR